MATMCNAVGKAPGVYIQEINVPGPIAGVATSTAAFVGPARRGDINKPTFLTNWSQFVNAFGNPDPDDPYGPYVPNATLYVTQAVRGFFDNGGTHCYFVRVGTAAKAWLGLDDRQAAPQNTLVVRAKGEGTAGNGIKVEIKEAQLVSGVKVARSADFGLASAPLNQAVLANAADVKNFRPGDIVHFEEAANKEDVAVASINVTAKP
jgi:phage tail sheath protein FI